MSTELSGVDLARQALVAAREAAKKSGGARTAKSKRRTGAVVCRDGREPLGLGSAISMMTERGMVAPAAGGSALAHFDDILAAAAPQLAGHVQAVAENASTPFSMPPRPWARPSRPSDMSSANTLPPHLR
ncbi:hypothetical protein [Streptomyces sp. NPDC051132]|uniref:hypothetical protein n=1 Tax=unclassified Streptomyces TaxID=2593676 RepID=UPI0034182770